MAIPDALPETLNVHPLTPSRWADFESLFGEKGACGGCWCMWWRLKRKEFEEQKGDGNRRAMKELVEGGVVPGLLAYVGKKTVGWCSVAPRGDYSVLGRSRILKPVDDRPAWSVVCFFVQKNYRRKGLTVRLLGEAAEFARKRGALILEGYPVEPKRADTPSVFAFTGLASAFRSAGFTEVARRSETRPVMRMELK